MENRDLTLDEMIFRSAPLHFTKAKPIVASSVSTIILISKDKSKTQKDSSTSTSASVAQPRRLAIAYAYQHVGLITLSENCNMAQRGIRKSNNFSENYHLSITKKQMLWLIGNKVWQISYHNTETTQESKDHFWRTNHFMGMSMLNNWADMLMPMRQEEQNDQQCQTTTKEKNMAEVIEIKRVSKKTNDKPPMHAQYISNKKGELWSTIAIVLYNSPLF